MFYYAWLNKNNFVVKKVKSEDEIISDQYRGITREEYAQIGTGWRWYHGEWIRPNNTGGTNYINNLKDQLSATDYKIIKCSEYQLVGLEMPYDVAALHQERQMLRDQINQAAE